MLKFPAVWAVISAVLLLSTVPLFSQTTEDDSQTDTTIPEILRRPIRGEAPHYPRDRVIGALGQGTAPDGAWQYAGQLLSVIIAASPGGLRAGDRDLAEKSIAALEDVEPGKYHIGGGRVEEDGSVSFLVRFLGREKWMAGELYLRFENEEWILDDLILEEGQNLEEGKNAYPYDFSPYERFF